MRFAFLVGAAALVALCPETRAADAVRGNTLYHATYHCDACHVAQLGPGTDIVVNGGTSADGLVVAIQAVTDMTRRYPANLQQNRADLEDIAAYLAQFAGTPTTTTTDVIEYYHAEWDHYFITAI